MENNQNQSGSNQIKKPVLTFRRSNIMPPNPYYKYRPVPINKFTSGGCKSGKCGMRKLPIIEPKNESDGNK